MASYNKIILMGNLVRDPESRQITCDRMVTNISLAVSHKYGTKAGEEKEEVLFIGCEAWGRTAEVMNQYLAKGSLILIEGRLKLDQWTDDKGQDHSRHKVVIDRFQFVGPKSGIREQAEIMQREYTNQGGRPQASPHRIKEDQIPF